MHDFRPSNEVKTSTSVKTTKAISRTTEIHRVTLSFSASDYRAYFVQLAITGSSCRSIITVNAKIFWKKNKRNALIVWPFARRKIAKLEMYTVCAPAVEQKLSSYSRWANNSQYFYSALALLLVDPFFSRENMIFRVHLGSQITQASYNSRLCFTLISSSKRIFFVKIQSIILQNFRLFTKHIRFTFLKNYACLTGHCSSSGLPL